jgi:hypothetical protein
MKMDRLLLASVGLLAGMAGARAADAVVMVEPEPVDFVRVCDVYGTGYFFIPGTETCLRIGGYVRMRLNANSQEYSRASDLDGPEDYAFASKVRVRLEFDTREDTELGTLRAKARVQSTNTGSSSSGYTMDEGFIQLGGLTIGHLDSAWTYNDGGIEDGLLVDDDSDFAAGDINANRISYTASAGSFSAVLSLEDDGDGDIRPDAIGKLTYKGDWGGAYVMGVYDEDAQTEVNRRRGVDPLGDDAVYSFGKNGVDGEDGAVVVKAALLLSDPFAPKSSLKVEGHYAFDPSIYAVVGDLGQSSIFGSNDFNQTSATGTNGGNLALSSEWQIGAAYKQGFGKVSATLAGLYGETFDLDATSPGFSYGQIGSIEYWGTVGEVGYAVTKNFSVLGQVSYVDLELPSAIDDFDQTRGFVEFKRTF